jgi:hypothetical protein
VVPVETIGIGRVIHQNLNLTDVEGIVPHGASSSQRAEQVDLYPLGEATVLVVLTA